MAQLGSGEIKFITAYIAGVVFFLFMIQMIAPAETIAEPPNPDNDSVIGFTEITDVPQTPSGNESGLLGSAVDYIIWFVQMLYWLFVQIVVDLFQNLFAGIEFGLRMIFWGIGIMWDSYTFAIDITSGWVNIFLIIGATPIVYLSVMLISQIIDWLPTT